MTTSVLVIVLAGGLNACGSSVSTASNPDPVTTSTGGAPATGTGTGTGGRGTSSSASGGAPVSNTGGVPAINPTSSTGGSFGGAAGQGGGDARGAGGGAAPTTSPHPDGGSPFPSVTSFDLAGPYKTMTVNNTGPDGAFTLFRPTTLGQGGVRHPIITWGNGTGTTPAIYSPFLTHLASHGFVVIASNSSNTGTGTEMLAGVQWLIDQNSGSGEFAGKLNPSKVGATGHSQGGGGALNAGADARVTTVVPIAPAPGSGSLKGPMALLCGGQDTVISATTLCMSLIYNRASVPSFFGILKAATHTTAVGNIGGYRAPATAWFRLQLMGDESARPMFYGSSCTLCTDANWTVTSKNL